MEVEAVDEGTVGKLLVPAGTPQLLVARLNKELAALAASPEGPQEMEAPVLPAGRPDGRTRGGRGDVESYTTVKQVVIYLVIVYYASLQFSIEVPSEWL